MTKQPYVLKPMWVQYDENGIVQDVKEKVPVGSVYIPPKEEAHVNQSTKA